MPGHNSLYVEAEDTVQARDPAAKIAIAEPGETTHEQKIAQEGHLLPRDMQDQVAVAVRRSPIFGVQGAFKQWTAIWSLKVSDGPTNSMLW